MWHIRYYDKTFFPARFRGLLGVVIRVLNWIRWRLEVVVQRLVLEYLLREGGAPSAKAVSAREAFAVDVAAERLEEMRSHLPQVDTPLPPREDPIREYESGDELPVRPTAITNLVNAYSSGRAAAYVKGKRKTLVEDFEEVKEGEDES